MHHSSAFGAQGAGAGQSLAATETMISRARLWADTRSEARAYTFLRDGEIESDVLTFRALDARARAIAAHLQRNHAAGERAVVLDPPGLDFVAAFLGCLYARVVAVPATPPRPNRSTLGLETIVADARPALVLTTSGFLEGPGRRLRQLEGLRTLTWIATDLVQAGEADTWKESPVDSSDLAFLQYTSGSTSSPRGVMVTHGSLFYNERMVEQGFEHDETTRFVSWLPVYHDMGLIGMVLQPLYLGIPCVLMSPTAFLQRPVRWLQAITRYRATTSGAPNFAYDLCVRKIPPGEREALDLSSWTVAFNGAEPVRAETLERFAEAFEPCGLRREALYPCYGLAEGTLIVSGGSKLKAPRVAQVDRDALEQHDVVFTRDRHGAYSLVSCGRPLLAESIVIVDPETGTPVEGGRVGEIWVSGSNVAVGYWNKPDETNRTFRAFLSGGLGPFLRTGDLGFIADGELFVTGRLKDLIIVGGQNHYPQDIELTVERSNPDFTPGSIAAFSIDGSGEERLVVAAELTRRLRKLGEAERLEFATAVRQAVAEEHDIELHTLVLLGPGGVPKTTSGKIQRQACRRSFVAGELDAVAVLRPLAEFAVADLPAHGLENGSQRAIESWLIAELARQAAIDPMAIDVRAPFARYGVSSMMAVSMTSELGQWLGRPLDATLFWDYPSIEALARYLAENGEGV